MDEVEEALRLAMIVEMADAKRRVGHNLGFALINYGRLFVRDYWTLFAIARELDCQVSDLVQKEERSERRAKWDELTRASEEILARVRTLPAPLRFVCEARGRGESWKKISRRAPDRLLFSMKEDFVQALAILGRASREAIIVLTSAENIFVVKKRERA